MLPESLRRPSPLRVWGVLLLWLAYSLAVLGWHVLQNPAWLNVCITR